MRCRSLLFAGFLASAGCQDDLQLGPAHTSAMLHLDFGEVQVGQARSDALTLPQLRAPIGRPAIDPPEAPFHVETDAHGRGLELRVSFAPRAEGSAQAELTLEDDAGAAAIVRLEGVGVRRSLALDAGDACDGLPGLDFGVLRPDTEAERFITVRLSGGRRPDRLARTEVTGPFALRGVPEAPLHPGEDLALAVAYTPGARGRHRGELRVETEAGLTASIQLCGRATRAALCARPAELELGTIGRGRAGIGRVEIESCGAEAVEGIATRAEQGANGTLTLEPLAEISRLEPGARLALEVTLATHELGPASGAIVLEALVPNSPLLIPVRAEAVGRCELSAHPTALSFGSVPVYTERTRRLLLFSDGPDPCELTHLEIASPFRLDPQSLPVLLPPGVGLELDVRFSSVRTRPARESLTARARGAPQLNVELDANSPLAECLFEAEPAFVHFGIAEVGTTETRTINFQNRSYAGTCKLELLGLRAPEPDGITLGPLVAGDLHFGAPPRELTITFSPTAPTVVRGAIRLGAPTGGADLLEIPIFAEARHQELCVRPEALDFGAVDIAAELEVELHACGTAPVQIDALEWAPLHPELELPLLPGLPLRLAPGERRSLAVRYRPRDGLADRSTLRIRSSDRLRPLIEVPVRGTPAQLPPGQGRTLYLWRGRAGGTGGIWAASLPNGAPIPLLTTDETHRCPGCHSLSEDGRYLAYVDGIELLVRDLASDVVVSTGIQGPFLDPVSWRPDVTSSPPYQFAYATTDGIVRLGAVGAGSLGALPGADLPGYAQLSPTWGPRGQIAFVRSARAALMGVALTGPADLVLIEEGGGTASPLPSASGDGAVHERPAFSPDGHWIAHTRRTELNPNEGGARLRAVRSDRTGVVASFPRANDPSGLTTVRSPSWSRDGRVIAFNRHRPRGSGFDLYISSFDPVTGEDGPAVPLLDLNTEDWEFGVVWGP